MDFLDSRPFGLRSGQALRGSDKQKTVLFILLDALKEFFVPVAELLTGYAERS